MSKYLLSFNWSADPFLRTILDKKAREAILPYIKIKIGSEFISGTKDIIRGLPPELEEVIMPKILGKSRNTDNYEQLVKDYWAEFTIIVNPTAPLVLDMTTEKKNILVGDKQISVDYPVNLEQYQKAYFCMQSSQVALTKDQASNVGMYKFVLTDMDEAKKEQVTETDSITKAMKYYLELYNAPTATKTKEILDLLRKHVELNISGSMSEADTRLVLKKVLDSYPTELINLAEDKNLTLKAKVRRALDNGILEKQGDTFFLVGDEIPLARGVKEMLSSFSDPNKSKQVAHLNARLEELSN